MRDLPQEYWRRLTSCQDSLRDFLALHGYQVLETPVIEPTELFLRKSGGELAARMYNFIDPGGNQVSLRPEYTASIVRRYLQDDSPGPLPMRVQYAGPVFRYQEDTRASRQFTQVGAELLGSSSPRADAEVLVISCAALSGLGLSGLRLELGDLGVLRLLLESLDLSERAIVFIMSSMSDLKAGEVGLARARERASQLRLLATDSRQSDLSNAISGMGEEKARELLRGFLEWSGGGDPGQRDRSEVVERLLRKLRGTEDPAKLQSGLNLACEFARVTGEPESCLSEAENLIRSWGLSPSILDRLKRVISLLNDGQVDAHDCEVVLDLGLARGLAYYTGIVFEIKHPSIESSLGGGGRYDGLAKALGGPSNVPALGFAYTLEHVLDAIGRSAGSPRGRADAWNRVLMRPESDEAYQLALQMAGELRDKGTPVEMEVCGMGMEECLTYAKASGINEVISVDREGKSTSRRVQAGPAQ